MQVAATLTARRAVQTLPGIRDPTCMRFIGSITLLASLWACQSYVAVPVQPVTLVAVSQRNRVRVFTKADVLLVIDDSFSMSGKQQRLAAALQNFTNDLDALKPPVDYQVAVTTTTVSERLGACGPAGDPNAAARCDSEWEAPGFSCDSGLACFRSFPKGGQFNQGSAAPAPVLRRSDYTAQDFARYLASSVQVGVNGARQPQGMEAMKMALRQTGFLRDGSKIVVAFFTDAEDCSDPEHRLAMLQKDPKTGNIVDQCAIMARGDAPSALEPVASYVNYLRTERPRRSRSARSCPCRTARRIRASALIPPATQPAMRPPPCPRATAAARPRRRTRSAWPTAFPSATRSAAGRSQAAATWSSRMRSPASQPTSAAMTRARRSPGFRR